jgi:hypothetical protein
VIHPRAHKVRPGFRPGPASFFTGLELVDLGLAQVHQWRRDPGDSAPEGTVSAHGAVARKPGP